jgi:mannose-6-phosphate isomerase-like protein (cupin superfamily)
MNEQKNLLNLKQEIDKARMNNIALFYKKHLDVNLNWDFIVNEINKSFKEVPKNSLETFYLWNWKNHNSVSVERMFYIQLVSKFPTGIKEVDDFATSFGKVLFDKADYEYLNKTVQYFINLVPHNNDIGIVPNSPKHNDDWDVVFIQVVGESTWNIYKNEKDDTPTQSQTIFPGDIIFIPKGVYHEIYALTPRAGISLAYNHVPGIDKKSGANKFGFNGLTPETFMKIKNAQEEM